MRSEAEPDRKTGIDGDILLTSSIHVYLPRFGINVHEGVFYRLEKGWLMLESMLSFMTRQT